ncbi:MAG: hypothetical protein J6W45_01970, partial [Bacteroidales bacterium]|nr:hypothetical protein [Bacteroidales bacterium]
MSFGNTVNDGFDRSFSQQATDIFSALEEIKERFKGANLGAVILATDGIYNLGAIPTNADLSPTPIYTIALGDTTICKDAAITNLGFNQITYLNNKFPVEISLKAAKLNGHNSKLTIEKDGKILFSKNIAYTSDEHFQSETVLLEADKAGIQHYTVKLSSCQGEASETNNIRSFSIEVIDGNYKVAVVAHSPHPDVSALKQTLDGMENYETNTFLADDFKENPSKYDFVVLHQLPSGKMSHNTIVENSVKSGVPILFIIGSQTDIERFDNMRLGLSINARRGAFDDATASFNPNFSSFSIDQAVAQDIQSFPPLSVPFGKYSISNGAQTLAFAKIGTVVSENPLVCFAQKNGVRNGFVTGEGLWRWRMADFQQNGTQQNFETLISKIATYLTSNSNKEKFRVVAKKHFSTLDAISFDAELYNDNYELVNTPEATLSVEGNGKTLDFVFGKKSNYSQTSIGTLPQGKYSYTAKT